MNGFEAASFAGATWGEKDGLIQRVHFVMEPQNPDGTLAIEGEGTVPVRAIFVKETEVTARETPNLQIVRESWGKFTPTGDFQIPLPDSAQ